MKALRDLLVQVPAVYAELGHALTPGRSGEPADSSPDPRHRPAPARLEVTEHRHLLLKGLRWWVDAAVDPADLRTAAEWARVGDSPARMCALLLANLEHMAAEDQETLRVNLWEWVGDAMPLVGVVAPPGTPMLSREALDQVVPQSVAAEALGIPASTVWSRAGERGGHVKIEDVAGPLCAVSDLPPAWCAHCRVLSA